MKKTGTAMRLTAIVLALMLLLCACQPAATPSGSTQSTNPSQPTEPQPTGTPPVTVTPTVPVNPTNPTQPGISCDRHTDNNGDEFCDACHIDITVELDFYGFNDLHGVFMDTGTNPGVDELTTYLKNAYADPSSYEILLSSGDMWQGSVESSTNRGQLMTQWMNELDFAAMTLGNHEYDWGSSYIAENALLAEFPFLGINVTDTNVSAPYCESSVVIERGGVKIGIIGALGDVLSDISGEFTGGISFTVKNALTELVKAEATRLRQQEGCQFIVYSIHDGYGKSHDGIYPYQNAMSWYDLELSQGYVDLVFEAHSHQSYILQDRYGVYHLQGGGYNSGLSFATVCYDLVTDTYEIQTVEILNPWDYSHLEDDSIVQELTDQYLGGENPYTTVLGRNDVTRSSTDIAKKVAQLYWEKGKEIWGEEYAIVLGGGFIKTRKPYDLAAGNVTYSQLFSLLPFDNDLVLCSIKGRDLRNRFLNSDYACAYLNDLPNMILDTQTYYIVVDSYTSSYAPNKLTEVARMEGLYARDLLKEFISKGSWGSMPQAVTIQEANAIGAALKNNETTKKAYEITGVVTSITSTTWGNLYIQDAEGNTFFVYGLYDYTGQTRYDAMSDPPQVGDTITVVGAITKYIDQQGNVIIEMKNACLK